MFFFARSREAANSDRPGIQTDRPRGASWSSDIQARTRPVADV